MTISARRRAIHTAQPEAYAAFLAAWQTDGGAPRERLAAGIRRLYGLYLPKEQWESVVLPARTSAYRTQMIDALLAEGEAVWRLSEDGEQLAFFPAEAVDWEAEAPCHDESTDAAAVRRLLERRGASFLTAMSPALPGVPLRDTLCQMALRGDAVCDSLAPLRKNAPAPNAKLRVRNRISATEGGRWELARPVQQETIEGKLQQAFDRWGVVCRETMKLEGIAFSQALAALRQQEYTGAVRRGYFVRGLSGAQFVRAEDFERIQAALTEEAGGCVCMNAVDPAQAWGRIIRFERPEEESFLCVPGTVVVLNQGRISLILERQGAVLKMPDGCPEAFAALANAFRAGQIYPHLRMLTVKSYPKEAAGWLEQAGFLREMRDYVLTRNG